MVEVKVFTLNCWGIYMVSSDRVVRMGAIGQHLAESDYDIVMLQEIWCQEDFDRIKNIVKQVLPYSYLFNFGIGGTGTCIFSKSVIQDTTFHEFSMNGYPHKFWHGDWFSGKGLGVCKLDYKGLIIHVFTSHYHAEYVPRADIYLAHRVMQSLEAAQWIKLTSAGADLTIYGGDFNCGPADLPYKLLTSVAGLGDTWIDGNGDEGGNTCGTPYNSYTTASELSEYPSGKRIDYIMYRAGPGLSAHTSHSSLPLPPRLPASVAGTREVSYSDHEAVASSVMVERVLVDVSGQGRSGRRSVNKEEAVSSALEVIKKAAKTVDLDQQIYLGVTLLCMVLLGITFTEYAFTESSVLLDCTMFIIRLFLTLCSVIFLLMASLFVWKERNSLSATRATLTLMLRQTNSYGALD